MNLLRSTTLRVLGLFPAVILLLVFSGCKKAPKPPAVSPVENPPATSTAPGAPGSDDPAARSDPAVRRVVKTRQGKVDTSKAEDDWRKDDDDQPKDDDDDDKPKKTKVAAPDATKKDEPEDPKEKAKRLLLKANNKAVDGVLRRASGDLKRCYDQNKSPAGSATIRFKVRSTGYVSSPSVSGVTGAVKSCLESTLRKLRVRGVETESSLSVERKLSFKR